MFCSKPGGQPFVPHHHFSNLQLRYTQPPDNHLDDNCPRLIALETFPYPFRIHIQPLWRYRSSKPSNKLPRDLELLSSLRPRIPWEDVGCREATSARDEKWVLMNLASPKSGSDEHLFRSIDPAGTRSIPRAGARPWRRRSSYLAASAYPCTTLRRYHLPPGNATTDIEVSLKAIPQSAHTFCTSSPLFLKPLPLLHSFPLHLAVSTPRPRDNRVKLSSFSHPLYV